MTVPSGVNGGRSLSSVTSADAGPSYLKAKIRIGSCKGPTSYNREQQVFHHDDIPESRRERVQEVQQWVKPRILSAERGEWNKSSMLMKSEGYGYPICERRQAENMVGDRSLPYNYNFRAETLDYAHITGTVDQPGKFHISRTPASQVQGIEQSRLSDRVQRGYFKRTQEMPTHPDIVDKTSWNISTQITVKEKKTGLDKMTSASRASTAKVNKRLQHSEDYQKPMRQQEQISHAVRSQKKSNSFLSGAQCTFNGHHVLAPPSNRAQSPVPQQQVPGSPNSLSSSVLKANANTSANQVGASTLSRPSTRAAAEKPRPASTKNRYSIEPSRKYSTTKHSGVWEYSKADQCMMWSDTGSFVYDSRGDVVSTYNPDALNLEGPTLAKPSKAHLLKPTNHVDHR